MEEKKELDKDQVKKVLKEERKDLTEDELEAAAGGVLLKGTFDRYDPETCKGMTKTKKCCNWGIILCDHYKRYPAGFKEFTHNCLKNAFPPYKGPFDG